MSVRHTKFALIGFSIVVMLGIGGFAWMQLGTKSPSGSERVVAEAELRDQAAVGERGDLAAAQGLRGHYCLFTDADKVCKYWTVRVAELGDEQTRCAVISQAMDFTDVSKFPSRLAALKQRGACK